MSASDLSAIRVHQFHSLRPGPRLLVLGAVHGNETCGTKAIEAVLAKFARGEMRLERGSLTMVPITNPVAYAKGTREGDRNLNRDFRPAVVVEEAEDRIANVLAPLMQASDVLLDLHSFSAPGVPFVFCGPQNNSNALEPFTQAAPEEALACAMGLSRIVHGWLPAFALGVQRRQGSSLPGSIINSKVAYGIGTTEYMRMLGGYGITVECGQHADPSAPAIAQQSIERALAHLGLIDAPPPTASVPEVLELYEVFDRSAEGDRFAQAFVSFDPVEARQTIATRADGTPVLAPEAGRILFPNPQAMMGKEWFYLARTSHRMSALER
jgi:predicted deacylase